MDFQSEITGISPKTQNLAVFGLIFAKMADFCRVSGLPSIGLNLASIDAE